jgi:hypothetical protein
MNIKIFLTSLIIFFSINIYASNEGEVTFSGKSNADNILKQDTLALLRSLIKTDGCQTITKISTSIDHSEPNNGISGHAWGKETWISYGCGKSYTHIISFIEDGKGGTDFSITSK